MIGTTFDFRSDAGAGDPDATSPTLRRYHQLLWSKPLPVGPTFTLDALTPFAYLHHHSQLGEFWLGSDAVMATFRTWISAQHLIRQFPPEEIEQFEASGYTIGGMMIFPNNMIKGLHTLNQARGVTRPISDRLDLTMECIRRWYLGDDATPLGATITRYRDFSSVFINFEGYVDFFFLHELVDSTGRIRFFTAFDGFRPTGLPRTADEYRRFRDSSLDFIRARNSRIASWSGQHLAHGTP